MTSKEQCLDLIDDIRCTIGCEYIHASILSEIYKYLDEIEKFINQSSSNPTFSECIKEWEERGWKTSYICDGLNLSKLNDDIEEYFYFDKDLKRIDCNCFISFDLIPLIHKTLKATEIENEKEN